jgi:pimeloyl-ACP methyl ester carboxylesterase
LVSQFFHIAGICGSDLRQACTGASTGTRVDASTSDPAELSNEHYPEGLVADALAAFRFLQSRSDINPKKIGFWGSSEGGMLATQVAARNQRAAFAINSSGFMGPLWQTSYYQVGVYLRGIDLSPAQLDEGMSFLKLWLRVARTGEDYPLFKKQRDEAEKEPKPWIFWSSRQFSSLPNLRWSWEHVLSFNPLPELSKVKCPVLGLWGEKDPFTNATEAERNMWVALSEAENSDFTLKIFPNATIP